jgi:predicted DNA-binding protein
MSTTIRVSSETKARIDALAARTGRQIQSVVEDAIAREERRAFFDSADKRFAELRSDPVEWASVEAERAELDGALADWTRSDGGDLA